MRRPARVTHTSPNFSEIPVALSDDSGEIIQRPNAFYRLNTAILRHVQGESRRVVSPVFEVPQALHENLDATLLTDVTDYSAHIFSFSHTRPRLGPEQDKERYSMIRGWDEALSPVSPPGFVVILTTALETETHPPNTSMNVYLVNSPSESSGAFLLFSLYRANTTIPSNLLSYRPLYFFPLANLPKQ
jgi:hypothetical protein